MKLGVKLAIAAALVACASVGIAWWWAHNMERKWEASPQFHGDQPDQDYFALRKFLQRQGIAVEIRDNLAQVQAAASPADAIYLPTFSHVFPASLADPLLAWLEKGGTLVARTPAILDSTTEHLFLPLGVRIRPDPEPESESETEEDTTEGLVPQPGADDSTDSVSTEISTDTAGKIVLQGLPEPAIDTSTNDSTDSVTEIYDSEEDEKAQPDSGSIIRFPDRPDTLRVTSLPSWYPRLFVQPSAKLVWQDTLDSGLVVLQRGRGFVAAVSITGRFASRLLQDLDNAELALRLFSWRQKPSKVWIVREAAVMPWWAWIMDRAWALVIVGFLLVALWFWNRARRFGPLLPEPDTDRRPLLEHVDASARWIWNSPGGPETLLTALRSAVRHDLSIRHPAWVRLPLDELSQELARLHGVSARAIRQAIGPDSNEIQKPPSPQELVRMVKLLQKLKERA